MKIGSYPLRDNHYNIPREFTCDGKNISPPLEISGVPPEARSLVLIVDDPDVPEGIFNHWLVWNIDPRTEKIEKNSVPEGAIEGLNDFGENKYGGPCPSVGTHVYLFKLYAIDALLPEDKTCTKKEIRRAIEGHIIKKALLKGFYCRPLSGEV